MKRAQQSRQGNKIVVTLAVLVTGIVWMGVGARTSHSATLEQAAPLGDAFDRGQSEPWPAQGRHETNETGRTLHRSLKPQITEGINEPHPFPEYMRKFSRGDQLPAYYKDLIRMAPVNNVQSKVFDEKAFRDARRIGVFGFENKTYEPNLDANAGQIVAGHMYEELLSAKNYILTPPDKMQELAFEMKLMTKAPKSSKTQAITGQARRAASPPIPNSFQAFRTMDAVLIGAVTKYMDTYRDRRGELKKSLAPAVEFGAFLISTKTGDVVWGARFVGSQEAGVNLLTLFSGQGHSAHWLDKSEMSRLATRKVIRAFQSEKSQYRK